MSLQVIVLHSSESETCKNFLYELICSYIQILLVPLCQNEGVLTVFQCSRTLKLAVTFVTLENTDVMARDINENIEHRLNSCHLSF